MNWSELTVGGHTWTLLPESDLRKLERWSCSQISPPLLTDTLLFADVGGEGVRDWSERIWVQISFLLSIG